MSSSIWIPALVALAIGLAAGVVAALRLGRRSRPSQEGDLRLKRADLEQRRDELYRRMRELSADAVESGERQELELAAARVLRDLEQLQPHTAEAAGIPAEPPADLPAEPATAAAAPAGRRWSGVIGFVGGAAAVGLISLLIYWAGRDATPDPVDPRPPAASQGELPPDHPEIDQGLPPQALERLATLERQLETEPEDLEARRELAMLQLAAGQYMESYRQAEEILARSAEDADGLFVQGVVRLAMGNAPQAVELFDRVLARSPEYLQAVLYRGLALYQDGQKERAVDTWAMGLEMSGGQSPEFERLLELARQELGAAPAPSPAPQSPMPPAAQPADDPSAYRVRIELAPGVRVAPGSVLFVSVRPAAGGPPVAARRVASPSFPLDIALGAADSMMGAELPERGTISVRVDRDGNASTRDEGDFAAEAEAGRGESVGVVLGG